MPEAVAPMGGGSSARTDRSIRDQIELVTVAFKSREPLTRLFATLDAGLRVTVVDNSRAAEDLTDLIASRPNTSYVDSGGNIGFGAACNLGVAATTRPFVVLVNPDTAPSLDLLAALVDVLTSDESVASCGPILVDNAGRPQRGAGGWQPTIRRCLAHAVGADHLWPSSGIWLRAGVGELLEVEWLAGTCLAVRSAVYLEAGGFDASYFLYQEDMDLGRRLRTMGHRQVVRCDTALVHEGGASSPSEQRVVLWRYRAAALRRYLHERTSPWRARLMAAILASGYIARALLFTALAKGSKRLEMITYARVLSSGRESADAISPPRSP